MRIPLIGSGFRSRSLALSPEILINLYPESHSQGKSEVSLVGSPGLRLFADLGNAPFRMLHKMNGVVYALAGEKFYRVDSNGDFFQKGVIPNTVKPKVDDNGTQIAIPVGDVYYYDVNTDSVQQVTMPGSVQSNSAAFIGQYMAYGQTSSGRFYLSAAGDVSSVNALDFANAESYPDNLLSTHRFKGNLWLLGLASTETWAVSQSSFPADKVPGFAFEVGCGARLSPASDENYMCWLSDKRRVYATAGGVPTPISTPDVEYALSQMSVVDDAQGFMYSEEGHEFYQLTFPTAKRTLVYDFKEKWWHERKSNNTRHQGSFYVYAYGKHLVTDYQDGKIYEMSLDHGEEAGTRIIREVITPALQADGNPISGNSIELLAETGITPLNEPEDQIQMRFSDTGADWSNWVNQPMGAKGERYTRLKWNGLGNFKERNFHFRFSTKGCPRLMKLYAKGRTGNA